MDIEKAMQMFGLTSLYSSDIESDIKKIYHKYMRKYHPDIAGDEYADKAKDVVAAYTILSKTIKEFKKQNKTTNKEKSVLVTVHSLIDIYKGAAITFVNNDEKIEMTKSNLKQYNVLVLCEVDIKHRDVTKAFCGICRHNNEDNYSVNCEIEVEDLNSTEEVTIILNKKERVVKISANSFKLIITLENNVKISIIIKKKLKHSE